MRNCSLIERQQFSSAPFHRLQLLEKQQYLGLIWRKFKRS